MTVILATMSPSSAVKLVVLALAMIGSCRGTPEVESNRVDFSSPGMTWIKTSIETRNSRPGVSFGLSNLRKLLMGGSQPDVTQVDSSDCSCDATSCQCCFTLNIKKLHLDTTACAKIAFVTGQIGFDIELTLNGKVILHQRVEVPNPPPLCVNLKVGSLCIDFSNLQLSPKGVSGCIKISAKVAGFDVHDFDLGCFSIPPSQKDGGMGFKRLDGQNDVISQDGLLDVIGDKEDGELSPSENKNQETMKFLRSIGYYGPEIKSSPNEIKNQEVMTFLRSIGYYGPEIRMSENGGMQVSNDLCSCDSTTCQCCYTLKLETFHIDTTGCVKIIFQAGQAGFTLEFTLNGKVVLREDITVNDPPPLCVNIYVGSLCINFTKLEIAADHVGGCIDISAKLWSVTIQDISLGCFRIPPSENQPWMGFSKSQDDDVNPLPIVDHLIPVTPFPVVNPPSAEGDERRAPSSKDQDPMEFLRSIGYYGPEIRMSQNGEIQLSNDMCSCAGTTCQCCYTLNIQTLHIHSTVCVKIVFLTGQAGFDFQLTLNGKVLIDQKISVHDPPPLCINVVVGSLCIGFDNLEISTDHVGGCIDISAKVMGVTIEKFNLGCFRLPPSENQPWMGFSKRQGGMLNPPAGGDASEEVNSQGFKGPILDAPIAQQDDVLRFESAVITE